MPDYPIEKTKLSSYYLFIVILISAWYINTNNSNAIEKLIKIRSAINNIFGPDKISMRFMHHLFLKYKVKEGSISDRVMEQAFL